MNPLIPHLFKFIKSAYLCKKSIKKCLKHDTHSASYHLAKHYHAYFKSLEACQSLTIDEVETLIQQLHAQRLSNEDSEDAKRLLSHIVSFFEDLRPFVKESLA